MTRPRRAALPVLTATLCVACACATLLNSETPGKGDPPLSDDPQWDLPWCTDEQLKLRELSAECFFRFNSITEGTGICPDDCCCDQSVTSTNTTYTVAAVGACAAKFVMNQNGNPVLLWLEPYGVLATGTVPNCAKRTTEICGQLEDGCRFLPRARASVSASPGPEAQMSSSGDSNGSDRTRNIALATVAVAFFLILIAATVVYYIVLPWLRGNIDASSGESSDLPHSEDDDPVHIAGADIDLNR